jgi:hypothetical protein
MGIMGAIVTTWATFVPCYLWIFVGAPSVERLHSEPRLKAALAAVTAAVDAFVTGPLTRFRDAVTASRLSLVPTIEPTRTDK